MSTNKLQTPGRRRPYAIPLSQPSTPIRSNYDDGNPFSRSPPSYHTLRPPRPRGIWSYLDWLRLPYQRRLQIAAAFILTGLALILYGASKEYFPQGVLETLTIPLKAYDGHDLGKLPVSSGKPRAALISLVRESELPTLLNSIADLEYHFNNRTGHHYPWIFFSESPFSGAFKQNVSKTISSKATFAEIPKEHWSIPSHIHMPLFKRSLFLDGMKGVGKAYIESYRHMCRWNSGFFFKHPVLDEYDYYWRVEPDVRFWCDVEYDVFEAMRTNGWKYGFNMNILDDARSFPALWKQVRKLLEEEEGLLHEDADLRWIMDLRSGGGARKEGHGAGIPGKWTDQDKKKNWRWGEYNGCQYFSNFEVGDLNFFRSEAYTKFFSHLDKVGGFFYERWGDAPIHTLALSLLLPKSAVHYFHDIGYTHGINQHCPISSNTSYIGDRRFSLHDQVILNKLKKGKNCRCETTEIDANFYKLVPFESPQKKPEMSCLRRWLGMENAVDYVPPVKKTAKDMEGKTFVEENKAGQEDEEDYEGIEEYMEVRKWLLAEPETVQSSESLEAIGAMGSPPVKDVLKVEPLVGSSPPSDSTGRATAAKGTEAASTQIEATPEVRAPTSSTLKLPIPLPSTSESVMATVSRALNITKDITRTANASLGSSALGYSTESISTAANGTQISSAA